MICRCQRTPAPRLPGARACLQRHIPAPSQEPPSSDTRRSGGRMRAAEQYKQVDRASASWATRGWRELRRTGRGRRPCRRSAAAPCGQVTIDSWSTVRGRSDGTQKLNRRGGRPARPRGRRGGPAGQCRWPERRCRSDAAAVKLRSPDNPRSVARRKAAGTAATLPSELTRDCPHRPVVSTVGGRRGRLGAPAAAYDRGAHSSGAPPIADGLTHPVSTSCGIRAEGPSQAGSMSPTEMTKIG